MSSYGAMRSEALRQQHARNSQHAHRRARGGEIHGDAAADAKMVTKGVHDHEKNMHKGEKETKLKLKSGGAVEGHSRRHNQNRPGRHHTTVVNVMPPAAQQVPRPVPVPVPARPPMAGGSPGLPPGGPPAMPPRPVGTPPGGMGMPAGGAPGPIAGMGMPPRARGGRMTAGAASGEGRLEKAEGKH